jgi:TorA maturation chaperone TorD
METHLQSPESVNQNIELRDGDSIDVLRANTYRLLATLLAAPATRELLDSLQKIGSPGGGEADGGSGMAQAWQTLKIASERATVEAVDDEYHDLFIGIGRGELVPYGSWYLTGFMMDRPLALLRRDLAELGIERQTDVHEPEDHVSALCETMSLIIENSEEIPLEIQHNFFRDHLDTWMGKFFVDLQKAKSARYYIAIGQLGEQFIKVERKYFGMTV